MIKRIIVTGDAMTHGGAVISGAPNAKFDGKSIARPGVLVDCPEKYSRGAPHGINKIIEGCKTGCGCASIGSVRGMVSG
ncbi:hypothetical protein CCZ27_12975 [Thauera sinica]|nr:hypothetical protein CCZ27_12975 [Thauera sp. K11]